MKRFMKLARFSPFCGLGTLLLATVGLEKLIALTRLELAGSPSSGLWLRHLQHRAFGIHRMSSSPGLDAREVLPSCDSSRPAFFACPSEPVK